MDSKSPPTPSTSHAPSSGRMRFGDRLVAAGIITAAQLKVALEEQKRTGETIGQVLESLGFVRDEDLVRLVAEDLGIEFVRISEFATDPGLRRGIDPDFLARSALAPLCEERGLVVVAMARPSDVDAIDQLQRRIKRPLRVVAASHADIRAFLSTGCGEESKIVGVAEVADVVQQVSGLIARAVRDRATDIHIEPDEKLLRIRFRVDGLVRAVDSLSSAAGQSFVARVKVLAGLDLAEHRRPQDGRFQQVVNGRTFDFRTSIMPTRYGENVVLRLLERNGATARIDQIGLDPTVLRRATAIAEMPHGLFLVTGPTGSGKTTTLYSILRTIDALSRKVTSIEDPIEGEIPLVRQSQVDPSIGYGFAEGLRAMLRQDPDVILVGEIRDRETAEIAMRASLTGHLVLATLHANDAIAAAPRLIDMGIEPFLLNTSLVGVLAQRLVRVLCPECRVAEAPNEPDLVVFGGPPPVPTLFHPRGCAKCSGTGYQRRTGIYELFEPVAATRRMILEKCDDEALRAHARSIGFSSLLEDGKSKVLAGVTSSAEVLRVANA